jgi:hypothetical protein
MRRPLVPTAFLVAASARAYAVDGVGLSEFLPALNWLVWGPLLFGAAYVLLRGFKVGMPSKASPLRMLCSIAIAGLLLLPVAYPAAKDSYARHLCNSEAAVVVLVPPDEWNPRQQPRSLASTQGAGVAGETKHQVSDGISEYWASRKRGIGVEEFRIRLVDDVSGTTLMSSLAFSPDRLHRPYGCGGNDRYWKQRELYAKKARAREQPS